MPIRYGQPGQLRKTFDDKKFDLTGGVYHKVACKLATGVDIMDAVVDGKFLSSNGLGQFVRAEDAARPLYMVFTANSEVIIRQVTVADDFPGEDRTDTPTGLVGTIIGVWPQEILFQGNKGATLVNLASYAADTPLTVFEGCLAPAEGTEKVVGYVEAPSGVVGANSIAARIHI